MSSSRGNGAPVVARSKSRGGVVELNVGVLASACTGHGRKKGLVVGQEEAAVEKGAGAEQLCVCACVCVCVCVCVCDWCVLE